MAAMNITLLAVAAAVVLLGTASVATYRVGEPSSVWGINTDYVKYVADGVLN